MTDLPFLHGEEVNSDYPTRQIPSWVGRLINLDNYRFHMSMSTVAVQMNFPNFNSVTLFNSGKNYRNIVYEFTAPNGTKCKGFVKDLSTANGSSEEAAEVTPPPSNKGRKPFVHRNPTKRMHGAFRSFGTSMEVKLTLEVATFKTDNVVAMRDYIVKVFSNNIQIPGCLNEDHDDAKRIASLLSCFFRDIYSSIPAIPAGFYAFQTRLVSYGEKPLLYPNARDIGELKMGDVITYSRNYTFHYKPLVDAVNEMGMQINSLDLHRITTYCINNESLNEWCERSGIGQVQISFSDSSDTSNRRIQLIFNTPQHNHKENSRNPDVTKASIESSGKINIQLSNNHCWRDVLWRIITFIDNIFHIPSATIPRVAPEISGKTIEHHRAMFDREFSPEEVANYIHTYVFSDNEDDPVYDDYDDFN